MKELYFMQIVVTLAVKSRMTIGHVDSYFTCESPEELADETGLLLDQQTGVVSRIQCAKICSTTKSCDVLQYCAGDRTCALYKIYIGCPTAVNMSATLCSDNKPPIMARLGISAGGSAAASTCSSDHYLVTGPYGVTDVQLSQSSYWCQSNPTDQNCMVTPDGHSARFGRRNITTAPLDSWVPNNHNVGEYIQVDFGKIKRATGVVLYGRLGCCDFYVKTFQVFYSSDCVTFIPVYDAIGNERIFGGCSYRDEEATNCFDKPFCARCIRIYPIAWNQFIAMRFDIFGF